MTAPSNNTSYRDPIKSPSDLRRICHINKLCPPQKKSWTKSYNPSRRFGVSDIARPLHTTGKTSAGVDGGCNLPQGAQE